MGLRGDPCRRFGSGGRLAAADRPLAAAPARPTSRAGRLELARAFAIGGEVEKAERWLDTARTRLENDPRSNQEEAIALVEGLIRCRAAGSRTLRHYDDSWQRLQAKLTVRDMQEVWLLRAFAVSKTSAPQLARSRAQGLLERQRGGLEHDPWAWCSVQWQLW